MNIIGISAHYHDAACCLIKDGVLVQSIEEERLTRIKHDKRIPQQAFAYCLKNNKVSIDQVDCIAYYESPPLKLNRQLWSLLNSDKPFSLVDYLRIDPQQVEHDIRETLGFDGPILYYNHHLSHMASSYYFSGFEQSAILTVDGVGEWATTSFGKADDDITFLHQFNYPHSIGLLYSTITAYLGFEVNEGEYKLMGLAPYGKPSYLKELAQLVHFDNQGRFELNLAYFDFVNTEKMYSPLLIRLLGQEARKPEANLTDFHLDVAKSMQVLFEDIMLAQVQYLHELYPHSNLCLAGGAALNCVANHKIKQQGKFQHIFIQPAAGDSGAALGAAALAYKELTGQRLQQQRLSHVFLGPSYAKDEIGTILEQSGLKAKTSTTNTMLEATAERLLAGKIIGWFQGALEFGPRALGNRSILADPRQSGMRDRINAVVKKRESFRPFAPAILWEKTAEHFDMPHESPFMLETCYVTSDLALPAITHIDQSARVQTVTKAVNSVFYTLIEKFYQKTQCPILLNTSFNLRGEPIVCSPIDALLCFIRSELDCLVLGDFLIDREDLPQEWLIWLHKTSVQTSHLNHEIYSFL